MFFDIVHLLIDTIGALVGGCCLMRLWMQIRRLRAGNPLATFVFALTDWIVLPLRRILPAGRGIDWASLVAAYLVSLVAATVLLLVAGVFTVELAFGLALVWCIRWGLFLVLLLVFLVAALSWLNPYNPVLPVIDALTAPLLRPIRKVLPLIGRVDLSPLVVFVVVQILLMLLSRVAGELFGIAVAF